MSRKLFRRIIPFLMAALLLCMGPAYRYGGSCSIHAYGAECISSADSPAPFSMTMLDVGQGLALLFEADGQYFLYDGGGRDSSSYVVSYLKQRGIKDLTRVIASHYDEDHIAGLIGVMKTAAVQTVIEPDYKTDSKIYRSFISAQQASGADIIHPAPGDVFQTGSASLIVLSADNSAQEENDRSIAMRIVYGDVSVIVTGDASQTEEDAILGSGYDLDSDVCIAGHHGSQYSDGSGFLDAVSPAYTLISCGAGNRYGHPSAEALSRIREAGSAIYRTDRQGEVTLFSDGSDYWFSQQPCQDFTPGIPPDQEQSDLPGQKTEVSPLQAEDTPSGITYIVNTSTGVFHYQSCSSVLEMADHNKMEYSGSRDELIGMGYRPCQNCRP